MCECVLGTQPENAGAIKTRDHEADALDRPSLWGFRTVLLVESRDDVFDRLASDLVAARVRVVRARCSTEAVRRYLRNPACLLVVNTDQPGALHDQHFRRGDIDARMVADVLVRRVARRRCL